MRSTWLGWLCLPMLVAAQTHGQQDAKMTEGGTDRVTLPQDVQLLVESYCYDCHGYGAEEGELSLESLVEANDQRASADQWWRVLKNVRAGIMPPSHAEQPNDEEVDRLAEWVKFHALGIDPRNPDPGPVTVRRLNRAEYGNTIRELMGVPFNEMLIFPPDDSGHGFDNVGDALMVSPMLIDKYMQAAEMVVSEAVPTVTKIVPRQQFRGGEFRSRDSDSNGGRLDGKRPHEVAKTFSVDEAGSYRVHMAIKQHGSFEFDPARYRVTCYFDDDEMFSDEFGWDENKRTEFEFQPRWSSGEHTIRFQLEPIAADETDEEAMPENRDTSVHFQIDRVTVEGPEGTQRREHPENYERFFTRDEPPGEVSERRDYAAEVIGRFATRAFRRPVRRETVERLVDIAESEYLQPETTFEAGIARAITAILASPRFLFRIEAVQPGQGDQRIAEVDEYALASRLSYFLWSSMPDEELFTLAERGELREQLDEQLDRVLDDEKAESFVSNFVGQWLRTRDVEQTVIDPLAALGVAEEYDELSEWVREQFRRDRGRRGRGGDRPELSPEDQQKMDRFRELREVADRIDGRLKEAMRRETELLVEHVFREDRPLVELLDSDYIFLNEKLAEHYGIEGVEGDQLRKVELPKNSPRGGVLTQAAMLWVTSNPTRTSPVKRGLYVLENILGMPPPPAPPEIPELEEAKDQFEDREPSFRELLAAHRDNALCSSCHERMDPLGLALENFNALGMWRDQEGEHPIDASGKLISGESFTDIRELKRILKDEHADSFYRCLTEKMMIYATGRGMRYTDQHTIDQIVERLHDEQPTFRTLLRGIVASAPFQMQRVTTPPDNSLVSGERK